MRAEEGLRQAGRPTDFMLLQSPGPSLGLKPRVDGAAELQPMEGDILDFANKGYVHLLPSTSSSVVAKFALTADGRAAGAAPTSGEVVSSSDDPPPSADEVLGWLAELAKSGHGAALLANGDALLSEAAQRFGASAVETVAEELIGLGEDGLIDFDDPSGGIDQLSSSQHLTRAGHFRLTTFGRDRAQPSSAPPPSPNITQIVHAAQAQVAAGDINNFVSFTALLDRVEEALDEVDGVNDDARQEARSMLDKLRGASGTVATGTASGAGGALLGAVLKKVLGFE